MNSVVGRIDDRLEYSRKIVQESLELNRQTQRTKEELDARLKHCLSQESQHSDDFYSDSESFDINKHSDSLHSSANLSDNLLHSRLKDFTEDDPRRSPENWNQRVRAENEALRHEISRLHEQLEGRSSRSSHAYTRKLGDINAKLNNLQTELLQTQAALAAVRQEKEQVLTQNAQLRQENRELRERLQGRETFRGLSLADNQQRVERLVKTYQDTSQLFEKVRPHSRDPGKSETFLSSFDVMQPSKLRVPHSVLQFK